MRGDYVQFCEAAHRFDPERRRVAVDGLRLCEGCRSGVVADLQVIGELRGDLRSVVLTSLTGGLSRRDVRVSGTRVPGIRYDAAALNCAEQMDRDIAYFCKAVFGRVGMGTMDGSKLLLSEVDRVSGHSLAPMVREVLRSLVGSAYAILDPAGRPKEAGPCPEVIGSVRCTGVLYLRGAGSGMATIECRVCGTRIPPRMWRRYAAKCEDVRLKGDLL